MPQFNPQQPPGPIPALDEIEQRAHEWTGPILGVVFAVGGFYFGLDHPRYPLVLFIGVGFIVGLLGVALLKHLATFVILAGLVIAAGFGTFWLFDHTTELRARHAAPAAQTAPASTPKPSPRGLLDDLRKAVQ